MSILLASLISIVSLTQGSSVGSRVTAAQIAAAGKLRGAVPPVDSQDATGKPIGLKEFAKKPIVLVFLERDCPYTRSAKAYFDQIQFAYRGEATVLGIIDADQGDAGEWYEAATPKFRLALDPDLKVAKSFAATHSLFTVLVSPDLKVVKAWPGISKPMFQELAILLSKQPGVKKKAGLKFGPAPVAMTSGNLLRPMEKSDHD